MRTSISQAFTGLLAASQIGIASALEARQLYKFNDGTFVENIIVRPNGHLLLDTFANGTIFSLDPKEKSPVPHPLVQLPGIGQVTGITEVAPDVYIVSGGAPNATSGAFNLGTASIFLVNLNGCEDKPQVRTIATVGDSVSLNGLASIPRTDLVFSADSVKGRIIRTDITTGAVDVILEDKRFNDGGSVTSPYGINGLKYFKGHLYFSNSGRQFFGRIKVNRKGDVVGKLDITYQGSSKTNTFDDFSLDKWGNAFVGYQLDGLVKITPKGKLVTLMDKNSKVKLDTPTSTTFSHDGRTLFVGTGGFSNGGGQVVAVKLW